MVLKEMWFCRKLYESHLSVYTLGRKVIQDGQCFLQGTSEIDWGVVGTKSADHTGKCKLYRDYELEIEFNVSFEEFRDLRVRE